MFALDDVESADAGADVDADHLGVFGSHLELRHLHRFFRGGDGEVNEAAHLLDFFFLDELEGIEVADFGGDLAGESGGVEGGDAIDAAFAGEQGFPHCAGSMADGADQPDAGDDNASLMISRQSSLRIAEGERCGLPQGLKPMFYRLVGHG